MEIKKKKLKTHTRFSVLQFRQGEDAGRMAYEANIEVSVLRDGLVKALHEVTKKLVDFTAELQLMKGMDKEKQEPGDDRHGNNLRILGAWQWVTALTEICGVDNPQDIAVGLQLDKEVGTVLGVLPAIEPLPGE